MAVNNFSGLIINNPQVGIQITKVTDSPSDWSSVSNDTYFYDKSTLLSYYKNSSGNIIGLFSEGSGEASQVIFDAKYDETGGIIKGQAVYVSGSNGTNILVKKADYSNESTSSKTLGLATEDGVLNHQGRVISDGILSNIDTSAANSVGDPVWLGDDGNLIYGLINKPYAPNHLVFIGIVTKKNVSSGEIFVKIQNGFELDEIHNVDLKSTLPVDGNVLTYEALTGLWKPKSVQNGRFGIANSSGTYTFYSTLQSAITSAVAGQTVEVFTDYIETSDTSVILKLGVNIQGNGHTYTLTGNGTASCLIDNGVTASCKINNYHLVRTSTTGYDTINKSALNLTGGSIVDCSGSTFTGTSATAVIINGPTKVSNITAFGSTAPQIYISSSGAVVSNAYAQNTTGASASYTGCIVNGGILQNATAHHTGGNPAISNGPTGKAISCRAYAIGSSVTAFDNSGIAQDCHGNSSGGIGFSCYINSISENCSGYSSATHGISINGGSGARLLNCNGYSTVGAGIYSYNGFIMNCNGYSTATSGIIATNGNDGFGQALNCTAISDSASGFQLSTQNAYLVSNCTIISRFASSSGHGLAISNTALHTVIGNTIQVTSNTANCISGASSTTIKYSQNKLIGALTPVNVNISQSVINTEDAYGNITL